VRYVGRISEWNGERGFGFVSPNGGGEHVFVHIKAFEHKSVRPAAGLLVSYDLSRDDRGRSTASAVRLVDTRRKPRATDGGVGARKAIGGLFFGVLLLGWLLSKVPTVVVIAYVAMSCLSILLYRHDKAAARNNRWRTQESTLQMFALLGGWPGALYAQDVFRHKSKKTEFQVVFWTMVVLNCAGLAWLLSTGNADAINRALLGT
jgi:uncharacterized membrane protein YsdA (DUF1294 family)/cold shock CspA family protein